MVGRRETRRWIIGAVVAIGAVLLAAAVAGDRRSGLLALNTLKLSAAVTAISLPVGAVLAFLLARTDLACRRLVGGLIVVLLFVPLYIQAAAWQAGFGLTGWFTAFFPGPPWLEGWRGAIWVHAAAAIPWVTLIVAVGLLLVEPELEEEALLEGTAWQVFRRVTLSNSLGAVGAAALAVVVSVAGEMTATDLFRVRTYAEELYTDFAVEPGEVPLGIVSGAAVLAVLILAALAAAGGVAPTERPPSPRRPHVFRLGPWRWPATALVGLLVAALAGMPLASLCYKAGVIVSRTETGQFVRAWSVLKCLRIVVESPREYYREFRCSLELCGLAASTALVLAIGLAWLARRGGWRAAPAVAATAFCLAVPGPLIGVALAWLLDRPDSPLASFLYDSLWFRPWFALAVRSLPLEILVLWHALRTIAAEPLDAAASEGAGPLTRLWRIALPQRLPALAAAWLAGLAVALGDLAASILALPPGVETLSVRIFGLLHSGVEDEVAGISLALVLLMAALASAAAALVRHHGMHGRQTAG